MHCTTVPTVLQILRDGFDPPQGDRRLQAPRGHLHGGGQGEEVQAGVPVHLCLGDQGPAGQRRTLPGGLGAKREKTTFYTYVLYYY